MSLSVMRLMWPLRTYTHECVCISMSEWSEGEREKVVGEGEEEPLHRNTTHFTTTHTQPHTHTQTQLYLGIPDLQGFAANAVEDGEKSRLKVTFEHCVCVCLLCCEVGLVCVFSFFLAVVKRENQKRNILLFGTNTCEKDPAKKLNTAKK